MTSCFLLLRITAPAFPPDFDISQCTSLGMTLMNGLSKQLGGTLSVTRQDNQALLSVKFTENRFRRYAEELYAIN